MGAGWWPNSKSLPQIIIVVIITLTVWVFQTLSLLWTLKGSLDEEFPKRPTEVEADQQKLTSRLIAKVMC